MFNNPIAIAGPIGQPTVPGTVLRTGSMVSVEMEVIFQPFYEGMDKEYQYNYS